MKNFWYRDLWVSEDRFRTYTKIGDLETPKIWNKNPRVFTPGPTKKSHSLPCSNPTYVFVSIARSIIWKQPLLGGGVKLKSCT